MRWARLGFCGWLLPDGGCSLLVHYLPSPALACPNSAGIEELGKTLIFGARPVLTLGLGTKLLPSVPSNTEYQMNFHTRK